MKKVTSKSFSFKLSWLKFSSQLTCYMMTNKILFVCLDWLLLWVCAYMFDWVILFLKAWSFFLNKCLIMPVFYISFNPYVILVWYIWIYMINWIFFLWLCLKWLCIVWHDWIFVRIILVCKIVELSKELTW